MTEPTNFKTTESLRELPAMIVLLMYTEKQSQNATYYTTSSMQKALSVTGSKAANGTGQPSKASQSKEAKMKTPHE